MKILQTNPKEKRARLQQLLDWGYISDAEAELMYKQYCLFGGYKNENTKTQKQFERKGDVNKCELQLLDREDQRFKSHC